MKISNMTELEREKHMKLSYYVKYDSYSLISE